MDPTQSECYATAQVQLRELFHELSKRGAVGAPELQHSLLPFAAGDVRNDVLELIEDLRRRRVLLDEHEFIRVMWRKMYLPHMLFAAKLSAGRESNTDQGCSEEAVNVPFTHVVVSIKRRGQMQQFASYYKSRGISGADHLTSSPVVDATSPSLGKHAQRMMSPKHAATGLTATTTAQPTPTEVLIRDLRHRRSACYGIVVCMFDGAERKLKVSVVRESVRQANLRGCSSLYCLLLTPDDGALAIGCSYFADIAQSEFHDALDQYNATESGARFPVRPLKSTIPTEAINPSLLLAKLEDLGLRNVAAAAGRSGKFAVSTGRKLHLWKSPEPLRVFADQNTRRAVHSLVSDTTVDDGDIQPEQFYEVEMNAEGDCLGVLGGSKLLGRAKTIVDLSAATHLAVSDSLVFAQTSAGELFSWQRSVSISNPASSTSTMAPSAPPPGAEIQSNAFLTKISLDYTFPNERVRRISCGRTHVVVVSSAGIVYGWGSNEMGQLGLGNDKDLLDRQVATPTQIPCQARSDNEASPQELSVIDVACGDDHSLTLTQEGDIFVCGCHWQGQLGLGPINEGQSNSLVDGCNYFLTRLDFNSSKQTHAYLITAQGNSSAAVTTSGNVYQWGYCVPSGVASVCGLVSRWRPEKVAELSIFSSPPTESTVPSWHSIAISHGAIALSKHATSN